jgi:hypothetical protein
VAAATAAVKQASAGKQETVAQSFAVAAARNTAATAAVLARAAATANSRGSTQAFARSQVRWLSPKTCESCTAHAIELRRLMPH